VKSYVVVNLICTCYFHLLCDPCYELVEIIFEML
jgi:hypothetical protein